MKNILLFTLCFVSSVPLSFALTVKEAYKKFYNDPAIDSNRCGVNTQKFLEYLVANNVKFKTGHVVSIHNDFYAVNHFNARWGSKETYQNGVPYLRSNWAFHVFAVIDGDAYDFSQAGPKVMPIEDYLEMSYLPASPTGNLPMQGVLTRDSELKRYLGMEMKIYDLEKYRKKMGPAKYSGVFVEYFSL